MLKRKLLLLLVFVYSQPVVGFAQKAQVLLFWSETCPGCIFYGSEILRLQSKFDETVDWTFVFPNLTSTDSSANAYLIKNKLAGEIIVTDAVRCSPTDRAGVKTPGMLQPAYPVRAVPDL